MHTKAYLNILSFLGAIIFLIHTKRKSAYEHRKAPLHAPQQTPFAGNSDVRFALTWRPRQLGDFGISSVTRTLLFLKSREINVIRIGVSLEISRYQIRNRHSLLFAPLQGDHCATWILPN